METTSAPKPWLQRRSTVVAGLAALVLIAIAASVWMNPAPSSGAVAKPPAASRPAGGDPTGLGTAGQSAEFNQTFATRLREDQARELERMKREMGDQLNTRVAAESERLRAEVSQGNQALLQRLDDMGRAQQEAAEAARAASTRTLQFRAPSSRGGDGAGMVRAISREEGAQSAPSEKAAAPAQPVVPPNGFVTGRLLNGVVATVGESPVNFLVAVEGLYQAANGYTVNLDGCMASIEGRANLPAGRIEGKPAEITCNFPVQGRARTWPVAGWVVDSEDGIRGLRADIVDNTGKKITASALAAALAAAGNTLSSRQYTTSSGAGGTTSAMTGSASDALAGGAVAGAGQGMVGAINEHFALYRPTLQKGGGARITLVIANELPVPAEGAHITRNTGVAANERTEKQQP